MTEMYLGEKDLMLEARRFQGALTDVSNEVQQLIFLNSTLTKSKNRLKFKFGSVLNINSLRPVNHAP